MVSLLHALRGRDVDVLLLHPGASASGSDEWCGDVDLLIAGPGGRPPGALSEVAMEDGFSLLFAVKRLSNTLEVGALYPAATSWTVVFVDDAGVILHVDCALLPSLDGIGRREGELGVGEPDRESQLTYLALKRIRKADSTHGAWAPLIGDPRSLGDRLDAPLGAEVAADLLEQLAAGPPPPDSLLRARRQLRLRQLGPRRVLRGAMISATAAGSRFRRPPGVFIAFGGVDGAGKSALTERLLEWSPYRHELRLHARPELLKPLGWYLGRSAAASSDPHAPAASGRIVSALRLTYLWADFVLGYWVRIWPVRARGGLVISERWWWDMFVDPRRHRMRRMPRLVRALGRAVPKPDAFLLLDAPSEVIRERKRELDPEEIERQRAAWAELGATAAPTRMIDVSRPLSEVAAEVLETVTHGRSSAPSTSSRRGETRYVAIPRGAPRLLVDPGDRDATRAALGLYRPSRPTAVAAAWGVRLLASRARPRAAALARIGERPAPEAAAMMRWIEDAAGRLAPGRARRFAAYAGSPGPLRKVTAAVLDGDGEPFMFIKAGGTEPVAAALENEVEGIARARSLTSRVDLPDVLHRESSEHGLLIALSAVPGRPLANRRRPDQRHLMLIGDLMQERASSDPRERRAALRKELEGSDGPVSGFLCRAIDEAGDSSWPSSWHFAHGDLTAWNCLESGGRLAVIDWEMSGMRPAGWDAVHFVVQSETFAGIGDAGRAADRILSSSFLATAARELAAQEPAPGDDALRALLLPVLIEGAARLHLEQPELSQRGIAVRAEAIGRLLGLPLHLHT